MATPQGSQLLLAVQRPSRSRQGKRGGNNRTGVQRPGRELRGLRNGGSNERERTTPGSLSNNGQLRPEKDLPEQRQQAPELKTQFSFHKAVPSWGAAPSGKGTRLSLPLVKNSSFLGVCDLEKLNTLKRELHSATAFIHLCPFTGVAGRRVGKTANVAGASVTWPRKGE